MLLETVKRKKTRGFLSVADVEKFEAYPVKKAFLPHDKEVLADRFLSLDDIDGYNDLFETVDLWEYEVYETPAPENIDDEHISQDIYLKDETYSLEGRTLLAKAYNELQPGLTLDDCMLLTRLPLVWFYKTIFKMGLTRWQVQNVKNPKNEEAIIYKHEIFVLEVCQGQKVKTLLEFWEQVKEKREIDKEASKKFNKAKQDKKDEDERQVKRDIFQLSLATNKYELAYVELERIDDDERREEYRLKIVAWEKRDSLKNDFTQKKDKQEFKEEQKIRILKLLNMGISIRKIAKKVNIDKSTVIRFIKKQKENIA